MQSLGKLSIISILLIIITSSNPHSYEIISGNTNSSGGTRTSSKYLLQDSIGLNIYQETKSTNYNLYYGIVSTICKYSPTPPSTPTVKLSEGKSLIILWESPRCLNSFNIFRRKSTESLFTKINSSPITSTNTFEDENVDFLNSYVYKVTSLSNCKESSASLETAYSKPNIPGDSNDDGIVKGNDVLPIIYLYGLTENSPHYSSQVDCNRDGKINYDDMEVIIQNYEMTPLTFKSVTRETVISNYIKHIDEYRAILSIVENSPQSEGKEKIIARISENLKLAENYSSIQGKIKLARGWNLISFPENFLETTAFSCNNHECTDYQIFTFDNNEYRKINLLKDNIILGKGYWIKSNEEKNFDFEGYISKEEKLEIKLNKGWNLIGNPLDKPISIVDSYKDKIEDSLWSIENGNYIKLSKNTPLAPFVGYWIYIKEDCIIKLSTQ